MSRSVKDLRELICISRLSIRSSESEEDYDDDEHGESTKTEVTCKQHEQTSDPVNISITDSDESFKNSSALKRDGSASNYRFSSPRGSATSSIKHDGLVVGRPGSAVGGVRRPPSSLRNAGPLPSPRDQPILTMHESDVSSDYEQMKDRNLKKCEIENILRYIDASIVGTWVESCNVVLLEISEWLKEGDNFISLANFLLTNFHYTKRKELVEMEMSFILNELELAFKVGLRDKKIKVGDLRELMKVILKEYPTNILGRKGALWLIRVLEIFCCGKNENYRQLLSDVRISTENKQHIQWLLGMRAFSLISLLNGILDFYRNLCKLETRAGICNENHSQSEGDPKKQWLYGSIEHDYLEVFEYLIKDLHITKEQKYDIIFKTAMQGSEKILEAFLQKATDGTDLNHTADSGSTALHVAVNNEKVKIAKILIENGADVNTTNQEVEGATPLHMAVITGHKDIVEMLVKHGADKCAKMGDASTAFTLAEELGHHSLLQYLS